MAKAPLDPTEWLKNMTSESVKQGENVRNTVRDLTLRALQQRELSLKHIKQVLGNVTEGASAGLSKTKVNVEKTMSDVIEGMDEALLKAVEANRIALSALPTCSDIELMSVAASEASAARNSSRTAGVKSAARPRARTTRLV